MRGFIGGLLHLPRSCTCGPQGAASRMAVVSCLQLIVLSFFITNCNDVSVLGFMENGLTKSLAEVGGEVGALRPHTVLDPLTGAAAAGSTPTMPLQRTSNSNDGGDSRKRAAAAFEAEQKMQYLRFRQAEAADPVTAYQVAQMQYMQYLMALDAVTSGSNSDSDADISALQQANTIGMPSSHMAGVHELDRWTVDNFIGKSDQAVFLQFYAGPAYCPVCIAMAPEMRKLGEMYGEEARLALAKTDAQAQLPLAERFGVVKMMLPAVLFFPPGSSEPEVYEGAADHVSLSQFLELRLEGLTKDGQLRQMRPIVKQFAAAATAEESQAARDAAAAIGAHFNASGSDGQLMAGQIDRYVAVMDRVRKRGKEWLAKQRESLVRKCRHLEDGAAQKKAQRQLNVLDEFVREMIPAGAPRARAAARARVTTPPPNASVRAAATVRDA